MEEREGGYRVSGEMGKELEREREIMGETEEIERGEEGTETHD